MVGSGWKDYWVMKGDWEECDEGKDRAGLPAVLPLAKAALLESLEMSLKSRKAGQNGW